MRTVYKYTLIPDAPVVVRGGLPRVVHVGVDPFWLDRSDGLPQRLEANLPTAWVELDPSDDRDGLTLVFIGTGHRVPVGGVHVGSCVTPGGLMWHVYSVDR